MLEKKIETLLQFGNPGPSLESAKTVEDVKNVQRKQSQEQFVLIIISCVIMSPALAFLFFSWIRS